MVETDDKELLVQFKEERTRNAAFSLIIKKYQQRVYWHIRKMVIDHDDADDVTQNTFVKVWRNLDNFREDSQLYTWIYRIATNECLTFLKQKKAREMVSFDDLEFKMAESLESDPLFSGDMIQKRLQKAILTLPEKQRLVFNMKYFDALKYEEMSEILGTSVGALKASYHHAVNKIETYLKNERM
jgi:RNA polymerase sigma-70 factor (ECF subfamily)